MIGEYLRLYQHLTDPVLGHLQHWCIPLLQQETLFIYIHFSANSSQTKKFSAISSHFFAIVIHIQPLTAMYSYLQPSSAKFSLYPHIHTKSLTKEYYR